MRFAISPESSQQFFKDLRHTQLGTELKVISGITIDELPDTQPLRVGQVEMKYQKSDIVEVVFYQGDVRKQFADYPTALVEGMSGIETAVCFAVGLLGLHRS